MADDAALASLKAAAAACAAQQAVACFDPDKAAAGLRMADELRTLFLPLVRDRGGGDGESAGAQRGRLGGARRVLFSPPKAGNPLAFGTPNSAFRRTPLRLPAEECSTPTKDSRPTETLRSSAQRMWRTVVALNANEAPRSGYTVRLVDARASTGQRDITGSDRVLTPARRSTRVAADSIHAAARRDESARTKALLEADNIAFAPNAALNCQRARKLSE